MLPAAPLCLQTAAVSSLSNHLNKCIRATLSRSQSNDFAEHKIIVFCKQGFWVMKQRTDCMLLQCLLDYLPLHQCSTSHHPPCFLGSRWASRTPGSCWKPWYRWSAGSAWRERLPWTPWAFCKFLQCLSRAVGLQGLSWDRLRYIYE